MKFKLIKILSPVLVLVVLTVAGCNSRQAAEPGTAETTTGTPNAQSTGTVLAGAGSPVQVTLPPEWKEDRELHDTAELQASARASEMYMIVLSESKQDIQNMTLAEHSEITRGLLLSNLSSSEVTGPTPVNNINGNPALQYQIQGSIDNINVVYLHTTVETPTSFHQILAWTLPSRFDRNRAELEQVIQSFREAQPATASPQPSTP